MSEPISNGKLLSRRSALRAGILGAASLLIPPRYKQTETIKAEASDLKEINTSLATFRPIYEGSHFNPPTPEQYSTLLQGVNCLLIEGATPNTLTDQLTSQQIMDGKVSSYTSTGQYVDLNRSLISKESQEVIRQKGIKLALEGVSIPDSIVNPTERAQVVEVAATAALQGLNGLKTLIDKISKKDVKTKELVARSIATNLLFAWGGVGYLLERSLVGFSSGEFALGNAQTISRISQRLHGLISNGHPERVRVFFRNAMVTRKLYITAEYQRLNGIERPTIAYQFGAGHSGVEDFIRLGPDAMLLMIGSYPKEFLRQVIDHNGGVDSFCTTLIYDSAPPDIGATKVIDPFLKQVVEEKLLKI